MKTVLCILLSLAASMRIADGGVPALTIIPPPIISDGSITTVNGRALPFASIAVSVNGWTQGVFQATARGTFSRAVALHNGENHIRFTAIESLPDGATGIANTYNMGSANNNPIRFSEGFRKATFSNGIYTARVVVQERPTANIAVFTEPQNAHFLELRFRNRSCYAKGILTVTSGSPEQQRTYPPAPLIFSSYMNDFEIRRYDLRNFIATEDRE